MSDLRFEAVPAQVVSLCEEVRYEKFPHLDGVRVLYVFDLKKKTSGGRITFARIKKTNDETKFLSMDDSGVTYDYVMTFDKLIWEALDDVDRKRIIYHEFCHCEVDFEKANPYGVKDHEIQGFYDELIYNSDDPRWNERLSVIAEALYDKENAPPPEDKEEGSEE